jgi:hypothetical protein
MSHTPGKLSIGHPPPNGEQTIGTAQGLMLFVATTGAEVPTKANARRLVACWNACEGLETSFIETAVSSLVEHAETAIEVAATLKAQRDELLAALKTINSRLLECAANPVFVNEAYDSFYQEIVNGAIATAEGTTP